MTETTDASKRASQQKAMDYGETLMYGQYTRELGEYAKQEAYKAQRRKSQAKSDILPEGFRAYTPSACRSCLRYAKQIKDIIVFKIGEDWIFLTLLGIIMALLSFGMDWIIGKCQTARIWLYEEVAFSVALQFFCWILFPLVFICFAVGFVHIVGPNAIGSGIPEMKTILRGVVLKEYLTFRTLIAKIVGLVSVLGCGIPVGKEGPFVHIASIAATLLGKLVTSFRGIYENESRNSEMLAAACAVGVACTFAAPIGGVLFSIEVTATFFAVRNYWRGFYAAVCGAFIFRLLAVWFEDEETLTALFKTNLRDEFPFDTTEMLIYSVVGVVCGFAGALFVFLHRHIVTFIRKQKKLTAFLQRNRFIFPTFVVLVIMGLLFPPGLGQYMAGEVTNHQAINQLFSNFTWSTQDPSTSDQQEILRIWAGPLDNCFLTLFLFCVMRFWMSALATTLPVPAGVFMPVFTIGAAFGRLMGESMAVWFPNGINGAMIVPGGYAIVGAAALSASVTHTISTSVIVFELTGQMSHVLPCIIAVLISNAVAYFCQPSFYDMIILLKGLPYFPDNLSQHSNAHRVFVEDFMVRRINYLSRRSTYGDAQALLDRHSYRSFPLVDKKDTMILLGSIQRYQLEELLEEELSPVKRDAYFRDMAVKFSATGPPPAVTVTPPTPQVAADESHMPLLFEHKSKQQPGGSPLAKKRGRFSVSGVDSIEEDPAPSPPAIDITEENQDDIDGRKKDGRIQFTVPGRETELSEEQVLGWERLVLQQPIDFDVCKVDPAPFQLVERTSLYKVHSIFSLLSLHHAYVTNMGKLVGIVSMSEVRDAVQGHIVSQLDVKRSDAVIELHDVLQLDTHSDDGDSQPDVTSA